MDYLLYRKGVKTMVVAICLVIALLAILKLLLTFAPVIMAVIILVVSVKVISRAYRRIKYGNITVDVFK